MDPSANAPAPKKRERRVRERTCVGCGKTDGAESMVRVVLGPDGEVAFDLAGHAVGRGAHVHPSAECLERAASRGLSRSFRTNVKCDGAALCGELFRAAQRRMEGLLNAAVRSGNAVFGREAAEAALAKQQLAIVMIACESSDVPSGQWLSRAIADGRAVAWGTRAQLGAPFGRGDVAVVGIRSPLVGGAIAEVCRIADGARSCAEVR
jgi:predicted RNA-binding protein YlxR (DUF448 family)